MFYIGDLVNTHGIKGEVRLICNFKYKDIVFKKGNNIYINDEKLIIESYRRHKGFDMLTFKGYNNINDVLKFKGFKVYINKDEFDFPGFLNEDLYGLKVFDKDRCVGVLKEIIPNGKNELLVISGKRKYLVPYIDEFVDKIDESGIYLNTIKGLIDED